MKNFIAIVLLFVLLFGCIGGDSTPPAEDKKNDTNASVVNVKAPGFVIASPKNGDTIKTTENTVDVIVSLSTADFVLKQPGGEAKAGEGHFHLILDNQALVELSSKTHTFKDIATGSHTLKVEIVNNDHTGYTPKITKTIAFTVQKEASKEPKTYEVNIEDFAYNPPVITIHVKDNVKWTNHANFPRSVTATDQSFNKLLDYGESFTHKFLVAGTYEYSSANWPNMKGTIIVEK